MAQLGFGDRTGDTAVGDGGGGDGDGAGGHGGSGERRVAMETGMETRRETGQVEMRMGGVEMMNEELRMVQVKVVELGSMQVELEVPDVAG